MATIEMITKEDLIDFRKELLKDLQDEIKKNILPTKKWLKTDELRKLLGVSAGTLQSLRISGTLTYTKLGGILYYDYAHIEKMMKENLRIARK